jgi:hypothetical protein
MPQIRRDRGSATSELVILTPILILLILLVVQMSIYFHASHVASAAAAEGATAGAGVSPDEGRAEIVAAEFVQQLGGEVSQPPHASIESEMMRVRVSLTIPAIVPFFTDEVVRQAVEPLEEVVVEADR